MGCRLTEERVRNSEKGCVDACPVGKCYAVSPLSLISANMTLPSYTP